MNFWEKRISYDFIARERFHALEVIEEIYKLLANENFQKAVQNGIISNRYIEVLNSYKRAVDQYEAMLIDCHKCLEKD